MHVSVYLIECDWNPIRSPHIPLARGVASSPPAFTPIHTVRAPPMTLATQLQERFNATPAFTRHLIAAVWVSVLLNPFGFDDLVCASPHDILRRMQFWRLFLSILYVPGLLSAAILTLALHRVASAWEQERGTVRVASYFLVSIALTNAATCAAALFFSPIFGGVFSPAFTSGPGIVAAFVVLMTRSAQTAGRDGVVSVFGMFQMKTTFTPLATFVVLSFLGANKLETAAAIGVGVAWARGKLDAVMPSDPETFARIERLSVFDAVTRLSLIHI